MMHIRMVITYKTIQGLKTTFESAEMDTEKAIHIAEDMLKTGRIKACDFYDQTDQSWTLKQLKSYTEDIMDEPHHITVYFDGGFDNQTRAAGLGCAIYFEQNTKKYRKRINTLIQEIGSNNEAEYAALHFGIKELANMGVHHLPVTFIGDSKVVVHQMTDEWPCYEETLSEWMDRVEDQLDRLGIQPTFKAVSRKQNKETDQLAAQALRGIDILSTIELKR